MEMRGKCDVVVIGAGIGGLCAAARLAYSGYKTVVLEKSTTLGGRFTYADYKGYMLPTGGWMILFGKNDPICRTLRDVEAPEVELRDLGRIRRKYKVAGKELSLPERGGLQELILTASRDKAEGKKVMAMVRRALRWQEPSDTISFRDWLLQYTEDEEIYKVFQGMIKPWFGINSHEIPAGEFFRVLRNIVASANGLLSKNGLKDVIDALESAIRDKGGEISTRTAVTQIVVDEDGMAKGVIAQGVKEKLEVEAKVVISNAGPKKTIELAGEKNFDRGYLKEVAERVRPAVGMNFFITSDQPLLDVDIYTDLDTSGSESWYNLSTICPELAPKDKYLIGFFICPPSAIEYDLQEQYDAVLKDLKQSLPGFEEHGEILLTQNFRGGWPVTRSWQGYMITQKTPIECLYNVGDGVNPSGWPVASGAAESARIVAEDIKARIKL
ncbi:MAG TPA: NAD(P)/FAD-dependent oxidoreductase [Dehalococcoidia bacterium]|nr:NAD(P)/FAD-dependent oxidoreductase [Dehalococcoidia bacterium]